MRMSVISVTCSLLLSMFGLFVSESVQCTMCSVFSTWEPATKTNNTNKTEKRKEIVSKSMTQPKSEQLINSFCRRFGETINHKGTLSSKVQIVNERKAKQAQTDENRTRPVRWHIFFQFLQTKQKQKKIVEIKCFLFYVFLENQLHSFCISKCCELHSAIHRIYSDLWLAVSQFSFDSVEWEDETKQNAKNFHLSPSSF